MGLEMRVHLRDDASRPVHSLTGALDKFEISAERLTRRAKQLTGNLRGLTSAFRELRATSATINDAGRSTGRLRGTIAGAGTAANTPDDS